MQLSLLPDVRALWGPYQFQLQVAIQLVVQAGSVDVGAMGEEEIGVRGEHGVAGAEVVPWCNVPQIYLQSPAILVRTDSAVAPTKTG